MSSQHDVIFDKNTCSFIEHTQDISNDNYVTLVQAPVTAAKFDDDFFSYSRNCGVVTTRYHFKECGGGIFHYDHTILKTEHAGKAYYQCNILQVVPTNIGLVVLLQDGTIHLTTRATSGSSRLFTEPVNPNEKKRTHFSFISLTSSFWNVHTKGEFLGFSDTDVYFFSGTRLVDKTSITSLFGKDVGVKKVVSIEQMCFVTTTDNKVYSVLYFKGKSNFCCIQAVLWRGVKDVFQIDSLLFREDYCFMLTTDDRLVLTCFDPNREEHYNGDYVPLSQKATIRPFIRDIFTQDQEVYKACKRYTIAKNIPWNIFSDWTKIHLEKANGDAIIHNSKTSPEMVAVGEHSKKFEGWDRFPWDRSETQLTVSTV